MVVDLSGIVELNMSEWTAQPLMHSYIHCALLLYRSK